MNHFDTIDDIMCSVITIVFTVLIFIFPVYGYYVITKNFGNLLTK